MQMLHRHAFLTALNNPSLGVTVLDQWPVNLDEAFSAVFTWRLVVHLILLTVMLVQTW